MLALQEAQRLEGDEGKRIDTINHQLNLLKLKEKEITEVGGGIVVAMGDNMMSTLLLSFR